MRIFRLLGLRLGETFSYSLMTLAALAVVLLALPPSASAALGGNVDSVQTDQVRLRAAMKTTHSDNYTVQQLKTPTGTVVREYVSPAGKVFAVAWRGPFLPDLPQLLGASFQPFTQAARSQRRRPGRGPVMVRQPGLVVLSAGHPRDYFGKAYLPDLLPQGVTAEEIQ